MTAPLLRACRILPMRGVLPRAQLDQRSDLRNAIARATTFGRAMLPCVMPSATPHTGAVAAALFAGLFVVYNSDGRELQPVDSQPTKLAARALARDGVLTLDRDIAEKPALATRPSFQQDRQGHTRSAYSVVPS